METAEIIEILLQHKDLRAMEEIPGFKTERGVFCTGCAFKDTACCCFASCSGDKREDKREVIFVKD